MDADGKQVVDSCIFERALSDIPTPRGRSVLLHIYMELGEVLSFEYIPNIFNVQITQCKITICAYLIYLLTVEYRIISVL